MLKIQHWKASQAIKEICMQAIEKIFYRGLNKWSQHTNAMMYKVEKWPTLLTRNLSIYLCKVQTSVHNKEANLLRKDCS